MLSVALDMFFFIFFAQSSTFLSESVLKPVFIHPGASQGCERDHGGGDG